MPGIEDHQSATTTKLLLIGDSGAGKSGALASLALAGYNLRILDMDNGLDVLRSLLKTQPEDSPTVAKAKAEARGRVVYETVTDAMKSINGRMIPKSAKAWTKALLLLDHWKVKEVPEKSIKAYDLGRPDSWGPEEVLVIDSLTFLGNAAVRDVLAMNARLGQQPYQSDWGEAQNKVEEVLSYLYAEDMRCNIVVNAHVSYMELKNQNVVKAYPAAPGKALSPKIGRYFNSMLEVRTVGKNREITTVPHGLLELKHSNPARVKPSYPIATGLADFFKDVRG